MPPAGFSVFVDGTFDERWRGLYDAGADESWATVLAQAIARHAPPGCVVTLFWCPPGVQARELGSVITWQGRSK